MTYSVCVSISSSSADYKASQVPLQKAVLPEILALGTIKFKLIKSRWFSMPRFMLKTMFIVRFSERLMYGPYISPRDDV